MIAASDSTSSVARTLASLARQGNPGRVEVIVAAGSDLSPPDGLGPGVRWIEAPAKTGVPRLRGLGLGAARAPVVAFSEDSCVFAPGWCDAWIEAFADPRLDAATGPVEPDMGDSFVDWAVFFCEYAPFLGGQGESLSRLAGNNFAVRVDPGRDRDAEVHETEVYLEVSGRDALIHEVDLAIVYHVRRYAFGRSFAERLAFGFDYGRLRAVRQHPSSRIPAVFAAPAIAAVQIARLLAVVVSRRRCVGRLVTSLPLIVGLLSAWSLGESLGWALGPRKSPPSGRPRGRGGQSPEHTPGR